MTFIASVKAKNGVAIVADSLVTSERPVIEYSAYSKFIREKAAAAEPNEEVTITQAELINLFETKPSFTKDYEEKLFQYDKFTAVTIAGAVVINKKRLSAIVEKARATIGKTKKAFKNKVADFKVYIEHEVKEHLKESSFIGNTVFIFTHYSKSDSKTSICKITVNQSANKHLEDPEHEFIEVSHEPENFVVVCDGQNRMSERILWGEIDVVLPLIRRVAKKLKTDFGLSDEQVSDKYITDMYGYRTIITPQIVNDIKNNKLTELSLQQAVDLAYLLIRIEVDLQKYTENIQTVGGVIKLATIDHNGFKSVLGNEIIKPENYHK